MISYLYAWGIMSRLFLKINKRIINHNLCHTGILVMAVELFF